MEHPKRFDLKNVKWKVLPVCDKLEGQPPRLVMFFWSDNYHHTGQGRTQSVYCRLDRGR